MLQNHVNVKTGAGRTWRKDPQIVPLNKKQWSYVQNRYHITPRELEIARMVCQGFGNEQIAESLNITHGTVKTHIRNLYHKLRVHNKVSMLLQFLADSRDFLAQSTSIEPDTQADGS